jgi:hypothetical protein
MGHRPFSCWRASLKRGISGPAYFQLQIYRGVSASCLK